MGMKGVDNEQQMVSTDLEVSFESMIVQIEELHDLLNHVSEFFPNMDEINDVQWSIAPRYRMMS